ncbi:MAG TPA: LysM peptidoglycan-binding domain-containing protein [Steroidobacteraceae bacterium]|nr:LysM peptidoglycan-binding domain-containing protein [Steroidobacteraceae bacterium]
MMSLRTFCAAATAALLLAGCAAKPPAASHARIELPPSTSAAAGIPPSDAASAAAAPPSLAMPREWQHHNGEDYDDLFDRMRAGFAFDEVQEPAIDQQLAWFQHNPDYLERVFQRAQRYLYHVVTEVEARGMPLEFALLPVVESAYEPFAYSVGHAAGLWQFIPATGARFGLKQDWWYDGRRDVIESTRAALDYLQALHDQFNGDWLLAIAAYNVGELAVQRAIDYNQAHGRPTDFWHLNLPAETRAYVPKLLAMKRLMAEPERYGFDFAPIPNEPYFAVIDTGSQLQLTVAAQLAGTSYDELVALNPGYNRWATDPSGPHRLLVPIDNADAFEAALQTLAPEDRMRYEAHVVERHETLASIAHQYDTSPAVIAKINDLPGGRVTPGESLNIPSLSVQLPEKVLLAAARVDRPETDTGRRQHRIVYRVRAGETLSSIARRHGMPVSTLARLNNLGAGDSLMKGQRLLIQASTRHYRGEGLKGGRRTLYTVRRGDTVYSISHHFQVSVTQLKSWNGLNKRHQIRAGRRLVMYIDSSHQQG